MKIKFFITISGLFIALFLQAHVWALSEKGGPGEAREVFLEEIPDWQARLELARLLSYTKRYDESIAQYRKLISEKPDLTTARIELARVLFWKGETGEAEKMLDSMPWDALSPEARIDMADIYVVRKEYDTAVKIYTDHLQADPKDHPVRLKLAQVLSWQEKYKPSLEQYELILRHNPEDIQVRRKYAQVLIWDGQFDKAIAQLEQTLRDR